MERWIAARTPLAASYEHAKDVLLDDAPGILPAATPDGRGGSFVDLTVDVPGAGGAVRQDVQVTLGSPCEAEGEAWVPIRWTPTSHGRLLPSFDGVVEIVAGERRAELSIVGTYQIPLGTVGRFGDGLIGRRVAQQSLRALAERMVSAIDQRVDERLVHAEPAVPRDVRPTAR